LLDLNLFINRDGNGPTVAAVVSSHFFILPGMFDFGPKTGLGRTAAIAVRRIENSPPLVLTDEGIGQLDRTSPRAGNSIAVVLSVQRVLRFGVPSVEYK